MIDLDSRAFVRNLDRVLRATPQIAGEALTVEAFLTIRESDELVPIDAGNLRSTSTVGQPRVTVSSASITLGYSARYALSVHENPRSGKTGGVSPQGRRYRSYARVGQWKYLEQPIKQRSAGFGERVGRSIFKALERVPRRNT